MPAPADASPNPLRWRWIAAAVLALGALAFWLEGIPRLQEAAAVAGELQSARARLAAAETAPADRLALQVRRRALEARLAKLPGAAAVTSRAALTAIQSAAAAEGVEVELLEPGTPAADGALERIPFRLRVRGTYQQLGRFMAALEGHVDGVPLRILDADIGWAAGGASRGAPPLASEIRLEALRVLRSAPPTD